MQFCSFFDLDHPTTTPRVQVLPMGVSRVESKRGNPLFHDFHRGVDPT
jgi:hypothetical protein